MGQISASVELPAAPEKVWAEFSNPNNFEKWLTIHTNKLNLCLCLPFQSRCLVFDFKLYIFGDPTCNDTRVAIGEELFDL